MLFLLYLSVPYCKLTLVTNLIRENMKNIFFILILFCGITFAQNRTVEKRTTTDSTGAVSTTESVVISQTEDITPRSSMIILNPLKFILFYNLSYFSKVSNNIVVGGGFQLPTIKGMTGFGVNAELRFHPSKKAMRGFYIAPNISFNNMSSSSSSGVSVFSIGGLVGWQWFPGDDFAMGLGIGVDEYFGGSKGSGFNDYEGAVPCVRFDIGYAW